MPHLQTPLLISRRGRGWLKKARIIKETKLQTSSRNSACTLTKVQTFLKNIIFFNQSSLTKAGEKTTTNPSLTKEGNCLESMWIIFQQIIFEKN